MFLRQAYNTAMRHLKASLLTAQVQLYVSLPRKTSTACISAGRPYLQTRPRAQFFLSHICSRHQILSSAAFSVGGCGSHPVTLQQGVHRSQFNSTSYLPETLTKKISGSAQSHVATRTRLSRHQHLKGGGSEPFEQKHPTADNG